MAIDVFFTGLMLICLEGQPSCPVQYSPNTAWVVQADSKKVMPCGWQHSKETTSLELQFPTAQFDRPQVQSPAACQPDEHDAALTRCALPTTMIKDICVIPNSSTVQQLHPSLQLIPRLDEVDRRFKTLNLKHLEDRQFVPTQIHFSAGVIGAGDKWTRNGVATPWYRSDADAGGALPRELSDRLKVIYKSASKLELTTCDNQFLIKLSAKIPEAWVVFRNRADEIVADPVNGYDNLAYLLWYYRLGSWAPNGGECPEYKDSSKKAVLLRCMRVVGSTAATTTPCYCYDGGGACVRDTVHWPPMLAPWF